MLVVFIASTLALTALAQQGWLLLVKQGLFSGAWLFAPDFLLIVSIFSVFFYQIFYGGLLGLFVYYRRLGIVFYGYGCIIAGMLFAPVSDFIYDFSNVLFSGVVQVATAQVYVKCFIVFFCLLILALLYIDGVHHNANSLELPFFISILFWIFLVSVSCYNFFYLFLLMELITLIIVVSVVVYIIFFNPGLVKTILQFFILNLIMSIFYLFGVSLLLLMGDFYEAWTLSYISLVMFIDLVSDFFWLFLPLCKLIVLMWSITFFFKITLAPFSVWVVDIYSQLPFLFLFLLMTVYKVVYFCLFFKLFLGVLSLLPELHSFWTQLMLLCVLPSMFIGCLAYREHDLKKFLAYTTVSQMGYIMAGLLTSNTEAFAYAFYYLFMYCLQMAAVFIIFILLQNRYNFTSINQLYLVRSYNRLYCYILVFIFFSFAGIPPLSGFLLKYFLFLHIYNSGFFIVSVCGLVSGFLMSIIYLQIVLQILWSKTQSAEVLVFEHTKLKIFIIREVSFYKAVCTGIEVFCCLISVINIAFVFFFSAGLSYCVEVVGMFFL